MEDCSCPTIQMGITDDLILPWRPPSFGVPTQALETLEQQLLGILSELVTHRHALEVRIQQRLKSGHPLTTYRTGFPQTTSKTLVSSHGKGADDSPLLTTKPRGFWHGIRQRTASMISL